MRRKLGLGIALTMLVAMVTCGCQSTEANAVASDAKIIRVAFNQSESHPEYLAMQKFGEEFSAATDGAYEVQIYPNAIMGDQGPVTELVRTGALEMAIVPISVPEGYNSDFAIVSAPYLYNNCDELRAAAEADVFNELFETTKKYNFEVVNLYTAGARNVYCEKLIEKPEDLKGMKIRVMDSSSYIRMMELMGGIGIAMSQGEVYTAIQQKVIDGGENSERVFADFKHYEVSGYYSYTNHLVLADAVVANKEFLDSMSAETRELFNQLMKESMRYEFDLWEDSVAEGKQIAEENGVQFVYPDIELFRERCMPLLSGIVEQSDVTRAIYDRVVKIQETLGGSSNE